MRAVLFVLLSSAALSCYRVETPSGKYLCDQPGDVCPPGQSCIAGRCRVLGDGEVPDGGTGADGAPADMAGACPGGGGALLARDSGSGREIHACPGRISSGALAALCGAGYRPCGTEDATLLDKAQMAGICDTVGGFFAANVNASMKDSDEITCPTPGMMQTRALVGCGREVRADNEGQVGTVALRNDCLKLKTALPCSGVVKGWTCTQGISDAANTGRGGALCCKTPG